MNIIVLSVLITTIISASAEVISCDVVIIGGTLAALGAAIEAPNQYKTCLVEPTDRIGGQLGDEGVWHIDFNWLYQKEYPDTTTAYNHANLHPFLQKLTNKCNTGGCWVSRNCFLYECIDPIIK
jgi:monoamine oxidase